MTTDYVARLIAGEMVDDLFGPLAVETTIPFGPDHAAALREALGASPRDLHCIGSQVYMTPHYTAYALPEARVAVVVEQAFASVVTVMDAADWPAYRSGRGHGYRDPETGREYNPA